MIFSPLAPLYAFPFHTDFLSYFCRRHSFNPCSLIFLSGHLRRDQNFFIGLVIFRRGRCRGCSLYNRALLSLPVICLAKRRTHRGRRQSCRSPSRTPAPCLWHAARLFATVRKGRAVTVGDSLRLPQGSILRAESG